MWFLFSKLRLSVPLAIFTCFCCRNFYYLILINVSKAIATDSNSFQDKISVGFYDVAIV